MAGYRESELETGVGIAVRLEDLEGLARATEDSPALPLRDWIALAETWRITQALRESRGNRSAAARALGIGRRTLYAKMDKLGLVPSWGVTRAPRSTEAACAGSTSGSAAPEAALSASSQHRSNTELLPND